MPPNNEELAERLAALEAKEIKVSDLPVASLRLALNAEPQNAGDILLPKSIGSDMLAPSVTSRFINATSLAAVSVTLAVPVSILNLEFPIAGTYLCGFNLDTECNEAGYLVNNLVTPAGVVDQSVVYTSLGYRVPSTAVYPCTAVEGDSVHLKTYVLSGTGRYTLQSGSLWIARL